MRRPFAIALFCTLIAAAPDISFAQDILSQARSPPFYPTLRPGTYAFVRVGDLAREGIDTFRGELYAWVTRRVRLLLDARLSREALSRAATICGTSSSPRPPSRHP